MELVYVYINDYKSIYQQEINFSEEYKFHYENGILSGEKAESRIPDFFSESFISVNALVGQNGIGKTTFCNAVFSFIGGNYHIKAIYILKNLKTGQLSLYAHKFFEGQLRRAGILSDIEPIIYHAQFPEALNNINIIKIHYSAAFGDLQVWGTNNAFDISTTYFLVNDIHKRSNSTNMSQYQKYRIAELGRQVKFLKAHNYKPQIPVGNPYKTIGVANLWRISAYSSFAYTTRLSNSIDERLRFVAENFEAERTIIPDNDVIAEILGFITLLNLYTELREIVDDSVVDRQTLEILLTLFQQSSFDEVVGVLNKNIAVGGHPKLNAAFNFIKLCREIKDSFSDCSVTGPPMIGLVNNLSTFQFRVNIESVEEFYSAYQENVIKKEFLDLHWGISSGENTYLSLYSRFYSLKETIEKINSDTIWIFFDEVELYFHPEWQRGLLNNLIMILPVFYPNKKIQLIFTSHSPIVLSDLPDNKVVFMQKNEQNKIVMKSGRDQQTRTFAQNISILYADSFFFSGALIGKFAIGKIENLVEFLKTGSSKDKSINDTTVKTTIDYIGESLIKSKLQELYDRYKLLFKK